MRSWREEAADGKGGVQGLRKEHGSLRLPRASFPWGENGETASSLLVSTSLKLLLLCIVERRLAIMSSISCLSAPPCYCVTKYCMDTDVACMCEVFSLRVALRIDLCYRSLSIFADWDGSFNG